MLQKAWVFFYGSFINLDVLKQADYIPDEVIVGILSGYDILIDPIANLIPSDQHRVYGILTQATPEELRKLYILTEEIGVKYYPEAVLVETLDGRLQPALCYFAPDMKPGTPKNDYIDRVAVPAKKWKFPEWYVKKIESFRP